MSIPKHELIEANEILQKAILNALDQFMDEIRKALSDFRVRIDGQK